MTEKTHWHLPSREARSAVEAPAGRSAAPSALWPQKSAGRQRQSCRPGDAGPALATAAAAPAKVQWKARSQGTCSQG